MEVFAPYATHNALQVAVFAAIVIRTILYDDLNESVIHDTSISTQEEDTEFEDDPEYKPNEEEFDSSDDESYVNNLFLG